MSHESTIKIYRSNSFGSIPTGLTDGELATNLADGKFFVGNGNQVLKFDANPNNNIGASGSGMETVAAYNDSIHFSIPKRTNLILYSHDFVSAFFPNSWSVYNASGNQPYPTVTNLDNDTTKGWQGGATGGFQIDFLNPSDANNGVYQEIRTPHLVTGEYYTLSCWARSDAGETKFRFSDFNYTTNVSRFSDKFIATTNPQRFYYVFIPESRTNVAIGNAGLGSHGTILVWGIQLERGVFPSSPIRSDGNETTTSASILSFSSGTSGTSTSSGVSSLNGLTGNIGLTGITDGAVRVVNNDKLDVRIAGNSLTGVAAFNSTYYTVSDAGLVSPSTPFATSVTGFNGLTGNIGLTGIAGGAVRVVNNDKLDVRIATTGISGVAAFNSTYYTVSAAGLVSPSTPFATSVTGIGFGNSDAGMTGRINLTAGTDIGLVKNGNTITISYTGTVPSASNVVNSLNGLTGNIGLTGITSGAVRVVNNDKLDVRIAGNSLTGVAAFNSTYYTVSAAGLVSPSTPFATSVTGIGFGNSDAGMTGRINLTAGTDIGLVKNGNTITISYTGTPGSGGDTVAAGNGIQVDRNGTNVTIINAGITGFNGLTGNIGLTGITSGAVRVVNNDKLDVRIATTGISGVAAFNSTYYTVSAAGLVSPSAPFATSVTGFNGLTGNIGLTGIAGGAVRVVNNDKLDVRIASTSLTGVAAFSSTHYTVSAAGLVSPSAPFATTGDTVRAEWPIKQSISGKRVTLSMDLATLWDPFNAKPDTNGYYWPGTDPGSFSSIERPGATVGLSGACPAFWHEHFSLSKKSPAVFNPNTGFDEIIDRVDDYCIFLRSDTIPGGLLQTSPFGASGSGIGVTGTTSGILKYFYLDINNLETASNTISTNDEILVYDSSETGEIKTKKTSISKFILDSDTLFSSLSPDQLKRNSKTSSIEFEIVLGDIDNESLGLITGVSAHSYINKNTVRSTNGCTGQITITGTQNEVNVSTSCPTIVIGLPDNVMIPYISVSGATFTETVSASLFIGSIAGGTF